MTAPVPLRMLSGMGRLGPTRRLRRTEFGRRPAREWLRRSTLSGSEDWLDDVTVLIGVRNRSDHRLVNALRTICDQTHPAELVHALVVDYGSDSANAQRTAEICRRFGAEHVRVDVAGPWSRGRCLNIGIRWAQTTFLLTSDVDMVFSHNYLADAVAALRVAPLSVVGAPMLDLPEESTTHFRMAADTGQPLGLPEWKKRTIRRFDVDFHASVGMTYTTFYRLIRGYDEYFETWGGEDRDLMARLMHLGLTPRPLETASFYMHQWHPKFEGVDVAADIVKRNRAYFTAHHTILRNDDGWGTSGAIQQAGSTSAGPSG